MKYSTLSPKMFYEFIKGKKVFVEWANNENDTAWVRLYVKTLKEAVKNAVRVEYHYAESNPTYIYLDSMF